MVQPDQPNSHKEFTEAVLTLINNDALRLKYGKHAAERARNNSHPDVIIDSFERIYDRAIKRVRDEIPVPLAEQSRARQLAELSKATSHWALKHGIILSVAGLATKTGLGRAAFTESQRQSLNDGLDDGQREALREAAE